MKGTINRKQIYGYWTIERISNGYLVKNTQMTAVFNTKQEMWRWLDKHTKEAGIE